MTKYEYIGNEDKVYYDETGKRIFLEKGTVFESKVKPDWDDIVDRSESKKKTLKKLEQEETRNDSSN